MSQKPNFSEFKEEIQNKCNPIIRKYIDGNPYIQKEAQNWSNSISNEIIKLLISELKGFKLICNSTIFQKN